MFGDAEGRDADEAGLGGNFEDRSDRSPQCPAGTAELVGQPITSAGSDSTSTLSPGSSPWTPVTCSPGSPTRRPNAGNSRHGRGSRT